MGFGGGGGDLRLTLYDTTFSLLLMDNSWKNLQMPGQCNKSSAIVVVRKSTRNIATLNWLACLLNIWSFGGGEGARNQLIDDLIISSVFITSN